MTTITVYGGAGGEHPATGEIGGNKILVEYDDRAWFLDFGTRFGQAGRYFDEFLSPRSAFGLRDFLRMGLIPPIEGIYRPDLMLHEPDLFERYRAAPHFRRLDHLDGVLLTHAHQDHNGCLGFLRSDVPVYTGLMTAVIGKVMQDIAGKDPEGAFSYVGRKTMTDEGALRGVTGERHGRPLYVLEDDVEIVRALEALRSFLRSSPGKRTTFHPAPIEIADPAALDLAFFRVDHSIPGSGAFALYTPAGWIGYTGDLRLHGYSKWRTERFAEALRELQPQLLIVEGTSLSDTPAIEEPTVHEAARAVVRAERGLVIADFSARNIERLRSFRDIALDAGRRLVVTAKDAYLLEQMHVIDPAIPTPDEEPMAILRAVHATQAAWEEQVRVRFYDRMVDAAEIRRSPGDYILCLSYWDITHLIDIEPPGGTYIYSSSEAHDEEQAVDQRRLTNWLRCFGLTVVGGLPGAEKGPFHASGHIDGPGMERLIETIDPVWLLPVHTEKLGWFTARWPEKVIRGGYGEPVRLG